MTKIKVSKRSTRVLEQFARYSPQSYSIVAPSHTTIAARLGVGSPAISNAMAELRPAGLLTDDDIVTPAGHEYLQTHRAMVSASIPIAGEVQAGPSKSDTLAVFVDNYRDLAYTEGPSLSLVSTRPAGSTVALKVCGASMESVRIYEGDHVIVDLFGEGEGPRVGDLVVARYVPMANVRDWEDGDASDDSLWEGPTVKYYYPDGRCYRLSPRRELREQRYMIVAAAVRSIGRVVGVYRSVV